MTEEWRLVSDFPDYEVSSEGQVRSYKSRGGANILKPMLSGRYRDRPQVSLTEPGRKKVNRYVSRMVAEAFIPGYQGEEIHFYNRDPLDCRAGNLYFLRGDYQYDEFGARRLMEE